MAKSKGHGGKLNRTEIVHIRLNPRARFALELMARSQSRTVSSFLETLVNQAITSSEIMMYPPAPRSIFPPYVDEKDLVKVPLQELLKLTWHVDEIHRFMAMCLYTPHLLSYEEEQMWHIINAYNFYWSYYEISKTHEKTGKSLGTEMVCIKTIDGVVWKHLAAHWQWIQEGDNDAIVKDIKNRDMMLKPGKVVTTPLGFPTIRKTITDEEALQLVNRLNKYFDKTNKSGEE